MHFFTFSWLRRLTCFSQYGILLTEQTGENSSKVRQQRYRYHEHAKGISRLEVARHPPRVQPMTIAACYLSTEGVVLGADSTITTFVSAPDARSGHDHYYDFGQKLFEFGERGSTVGLVFWGIASLGPKSYRTLIAEAADEAAQQRVGSFDEINELVVDKIWGQHSSAFQTQLTQLRVLEDKGRERTSEENDEWSFLLNGLAGGFCLAGRWETDRISKGSATILDPLKNERPDPQELSLGMPAFWGCPNFLNRLIYGGDYELFMRVLDCDKWHGTEDDLFALFAGGALGQPYDLPLREAIDWIYSSIYTTIKGMKFSHLSPVCGGPIDVAVISSDRPFRWVCHKNMARAIVTHHIGTD